MFIDLVVNFWKSTENVTSPITINATGLQEELKLQSQQEPHAEATETEKRRLHRERLSSFVSLLKSEEEVWVVGFDTH